jgi:arsenic resistance protein ArsH
VWFLVEVVVEVGMNGCALVRFNVLLRPHTAHVVDRYSDRKESGVPVDLAIHLSSISTLGR